MKLKLNNEIRLSIDMDNDEEPESPRPEPVPQVPKKKEIIIKCCPFSCSKVFQVCVEEIFKIVLEIALDQALMLKMTNHFFAN